MNKILVVVVIAGLVALGAGLNYHFIVMDEHKIKILKKTDLTLDKTFIDARGAKRLKLILDPDLVKAGVKDLIRDTVK